MCATDIVTKRVPTFFFIGVTTSRSSIMKVFPLWMEALGHPEVVIEGVDLALHDAPERYRHTVAQIKHDPLSVGALVTTHKIDLLDATRDMFDVLGPHAQTCDEISCIVKEGNILEGYAIDPIAGGLSLDAVLGGGYVSSGGYFARTGGEVLCFGAGGAATAISLHLINKEAPGDRPRRFVVVNRSPGRLEKLRKMVQRLGTDIVFETVCNQDPRQNDALMAGLPEGSVVINATGMGKDRPGSPITGDGRFPRNGVAWELNYRGELDFLHQALAQKARRQLTVEDGWLYFLHGWTQAISRVLHIEIDRATFDRLGRIAASVRRAE
jgi:shikimate dehydrogenase